MFAGDDFNVDLLSGLERQAWGQRDAGAAYVERQTTLWVLDNDALEMLADVQAKCVDVLLQ